MADSIGNSGNDLIVSIGADTTDFQSSLAGLGQTLLTAIGDINPVVAGVVASVAAIGTAAVESFDTIEEAENQLIDQTGATGDKLDGLKSSLDDVFTNVPTDANAAATAIATLSDRLGTAGDALTDLVTQMAKLSDISGSSIDQIANAASQAFNNWQVSTEDQSGALDTLNQISQTYHINVVQLAQDLADVGLKAQGAGLDFDQTANVIGNLSTQGINVTSVMQGFNKALTAMQEAGGDVSQITLPGLIKGIQDAGSESDITSAAIQTFGQRTGDQLAVAINAGKLSVDTLTQSLNDATGSINNTYAATDTFSRELTIAQQNFESFIAPIGAFVAGTAKDLLTWLNNTNGAWANFGSGLSAVLGPMGISIAAIVQAFNATKTSVDALPLDIGNVSTSLSGLTLTVGASTQATNDNTAAIGNSLAALQAAQQNADLLKASVSLLDQAQTQHAADMKALVIPTLTDVATAQQNLTTYQQEAVLADQNLVTAENALQALVQSHSTDNNALSLAEENLTLAKNAAVQADSAYSQAEKDLTNSKSANQAMTTALQQAETALASARASQHIPAAMNLQQAEAAVSSALETQDEMYGTLQDAEAALSAFRNSTGVKDSTTEQQLIANVTGAQQDLTNATKAVTQAQSDQTTVSGTLQKLNQSIFSDTQTYASYLKATVIPGNQDLDTALQNVQTAQQNLQTSGENLREATINESVANADLIDGTGSYPDVTAAVNAGKVAKDALKVSETALSDAVQQTTQNYGLSLAQINLVNQANGLSVDSNTTLINSYQDLGLKSSDAWQGMATAANQAYQNIATNGVTNFGTLNAAIIADLTAQQTADSATWTAMPAAQQIALATAKQQQSDFTTDSVTQWSTMYTSIDKSVQQCSTDMINTLVTGNGSFGDEALKMLDSIGDAVLTAFIKPITDGIAQLISGALTNLMSSLGGVQSALTGIGSSIGGIFGGGGSMPASAGGDAGIASLPLDSGSAASSASSSVSSGVGAISSSVTSLLSAIGAIGSLITGAIGDIQNITIEGKLASIEENTRQTYTFLGLDNNGTNGLLLAIDYLIGPPMTYFSGTFQSWADGLSDTVENIDSNSGYEMSYLLTIANWDLATQFTNLGTTITNMGTTLVNAITQSVPIVNVAVTLDSTPIIAAVETSIQKGTS